MGGGVWCWWCLVGRAGGVLVRARGRAWLTARVLVRAGRYYCSTQRRAGQRAAGPARTGSALLVAAAGSARRPWLFAPPTIVVRSTVLACFLEVRSTQWWAKNNPRHRNNHNRSTHHCSTVLVQQPGSSGGTGSKAAVLDAYSQ